MDHPQDIESTLNALLLNTKELQETSDDPVADVELSDTQKRLLDHLLYQWNHLSEEDKKELLNAQVETKVLELAKKNQACLREVRSRISQKSRRPSSEQLDFTFYS